MSAITLLLTGYSGAGKTTIARELKQEFIKKNLPVELLDGDIIRKNLSAGLGFSKKDRLSNAQRIGFIASLLSRHGVNVIIAMIAPYEECRAHIRQQVRNYREIYVKCPLNVCEKRDVKGLYKKVRNGEIRHFTGICDPFEEPLCPDVTCETDKETLSASINKILRHLDIYPKKEKETPATILYGQPQ